MKRDKGEQDSYIFGWQRAEFLFFQWDGTGQWPGEDNPFEDDDIANKGFEDAVYTLTQK